MSRGRDKEIPHGVLPMEQLVLSDRWARKMCFAIGPQRSEANFSKRKDFWPRGDKTFFHAQLK